MKPEETIDFHIKYAWQNIYKMYNEVAGRYGTNMAVGYLLLNIDLENGTPATYLGPKIGLESTSLSRTLKSMEEQGLIVRTPHPTDRRSVLVCLTEFGIEKREDAKKAVYDFNRAIRAKLSPEKISMFFEIIGEINDVVLEQRNINPQ